MSIKLMSAIFETEFPDFLINANGEKTKASTAKLVLLAIADHANDEGESAYPGLRRIERKTGLSRQGIIDTIDSLKFNGLLSVSDEPSRIGTNNYTIVTSAYPSLGGTPGVLVQWVVEGGQPSVPPPVNPLDHNHHLTIIKTSSSSGLKISGIEQAILQGRPVTEEDMKASKKGFPYREKFPDPNRELLDVFYECRPIPLLKKDVFDWLSTSGEWIEIGAMPQDIRDAFKKSLPDPVTGKGGFSVSRPGSLTSTIQAVIGERRTKPKSNGSMKEFLDRYALEHPNE